MRILPTGSTIGILGGGQLARMTAMAAARLGYCCHIFCQSSDEPAVAVSVAQTFAAFEDKAALQKFAKVVDVVTYDWENIPVTALRAVNEITPVFPNASALEVAQDRLAEKSFARSIGLGTADFLEIKSLNDLSEACRSFPLPAILKSTRMGYDGKGQYKISSPAEAVTAWQSIGGDRGMTGILEGYVDFTQEVSVIVGRREDDAMTSYPVVENIHRNHILFETHAPAHIDTVIAVEAESAARLLAEKLNVVGLLAVEMFVLRQPDILGHRILINEIAPRPHNSGHWTIDACPVSQFELLVRTIGGLPLGDTKPHSKAIMRNLIGGDVSDWMTYAADQNCCVHLYGKTEIRTGRKMGHVTFLGEKY